jgi:molybdate transport system substrate-binding protein
VRRIVAALCLAASLPSCAAGQKAAPEMKTLTVLAASSLTSAFEAIAKEYERTHPSIRLALSYAGTSTLVAQIQQGAGADVFASADEASMQKLIDSRRIAPGASHVLTRNFLEIVVQKGNPKHIRGLGDLERESLRIALAAPAVPAGRYAAEAFRKAELDPPMASEEADVKAVVTKVSLGEADAGVVYVTDVLAGGDKIEGVKIPAAQNVEARYAIAPIASSKHADEARAFVDYAVSPLGQVKLRQFGFTPL